MEPFWKKFVEDLETELRHRRHGDADGLALLQPNAYGCTAEPYTDEAFRYWGDALATDGDDPEILHHLAIMHHARAIDLEHSSVPARSDEDWRTADRLWAMLYDSASFWTDLVSAARVDSSLIDSTRRDLVERCVGMHMAIAFEDGQSGVAADLERRRFHFEMALSSPFPTEVVERARGKAYAGHVAGIQPHAWEDSCLDQDVLDQAIVAIESYLDVDSQYLPALRDLISFLVRRQECFVQEMKSLSAQLGSNNLAYSSCVLRSAVYDIRAITYIEPILVQFRDLPLSQQYPVLESIVIWFDRLGMACANLERYDEAIGYYDRAIDFANQHDYDNVKEMAELREERLEALINQVEQLDQRTDAQSRRLLDKRMAEISEDLDPPPAIQLRRARLYCRRGELDRAETDVQALQVRLAGGLIESARELAQEAANLQEEIEIALVIQRLKGPIESEDWHRVLAVLEAHPHRSHPSLALLEIRACCALGRGSEARVCLRNLKHRQEECPDAALEFIVEQGERLVQFLPPEQGNPLDAATRLNAAGDSAGAAGICDALISADPEHLEAYLVRALCRDRMGDGIGARADLTHAEQTALERGDPALLERINGLRASLVSVIPSGPAYQEGGRW